MSDKRKDKSVDTVIDRTETQLAPPPADAPLAQRPAELGPVASVMQLIQMGIEKNIAPEALERLSAMLEKAREREAIAEFGDALDAFQQECPLIPKNKSAKITTKNGGSYGYLFADLDSIMRIVRPLLHKHGFSFKWDGGAEKGMVNCTFVLRHRGGHTESSSFSAPPDTAAAMSGAQANSAALTTVQRRTMLMGLGITTCDPDTDGASKLKISEHQAANLSAKMDELKPDDRVRLVTLLGIKSPADVLATQFGPAIAAVEAKLNSYKGKP